MTKNCSRCSTALKKTDKDGVCLNCKQANPNAEVPMIDSVLMYVDFHRHGSTKEMLVKTMCSFFSKDELLAAKTLLYERYRNLGILLNDTNRRGSDNRTDTMATSCDIVDDLFRLEEHNVSFICCATNWSRVPKVAPEETSDISLAEKFAELEAKLVGINSEIKGIKSKNTNIDERVGKLEAVSSIPDVSSSVCVTGARENTYVPKTPLPPKTTPAGRVGQNGVKTGGNRAKPVVAPKINTTDNKETDGARVERRRWSTGHDYGHPAAVQEGFSVVARDRAKRGRLMGQAKAGGLRASGMPLRDFFVYRVHCEDGTEEIKRFLISNDIEAVKIEQKNVSGSKFNSFKISVKMDCAKKMMDADMWSTGICVRRWRQFTNNSQ